MAGTAAMPIGGQRRDDEVRRVVGLCRQISSANNEQVRIIMGWSRPGKQTRLRATGYDVRLIRKE
jgi:hypothetical protein